MVHGFNSLNPGPGSNFIHFPVRFRILGYGFYQWLVLVRFWIKIVFISSPDFFLARVRILSNFSPDPDFIKHVRFNQFRVRVQFRNLPMPRFTDVSSLTIRSRISLKHVKRRNNLLHVWPGFFLRRVQQCGRSPRARCTSTRFYTQGIQIGTSTPSAHRALTFLNAPLVSYSDLGIGKGVMSTKAYFQPSPRQVSLPHQHSN